MGEKNISFTYAPAPESYQINVQKQYELFIDGEFVKPESNKYRKIINPSNESFLSMVPEANNKDVDKAVAAAKNAYSKWSLLAPTERGQYIFRLARLIQETSRELAILETMNNGKPIKETRDFDIPTAAQYFFYYAGWADKLEYAYPNCQVSSLGVVGQIIPWNFPLMMLAWKIAPALATGNTVVLKPAETTPLTAMRFAQLCQQAEIPKGVVNIITGDGATGEMIVKHPDIAKIAFTGSTNVGKHIQRLIASSKKHLSLELGGKGAHLIFDDAAITQAVEGVVNGIYFNQGQVCCAGSRLLLQENIAEDFIFLLKQRMSHLIAGNPLDKNTDIGAINSKEQLERITSLVQEGVNQGADLYQSPCHLPSKGFWYPPSLFLNASPSYKISREEIFGPVLTVMTFRTTDEAISKANNTRYGLSSGIWSNSGSKILYVASKLKAGVIWSNTYNKFDPTSPFGGFKESGFGREGGIPGLENYLEVNNKENGSR